MDGVIQFLIHHGYSVLFLWILLERLAIPLPVSPLLLVAGALAEIGRLRFPFVLGTAITASLLGDLFWYQMGLRRGNRILSFLCRISLDPESCVRRAKGIFAKLGTRSILVARFIPGLSTFGPPLAGAFHMRGLHFLLLDGLGTFSWAVLFVGLGFQFGHEIDDLAFQSTGLTPWIGWIVPMGIALYILWKYFQRKRFLRHLTLARITPEEVKQRLDAGEDILIVDLRDAFEFHEKPQTIPGAFHLSIEELEAQHHKIPRDREIVLFCT
jgi:membrane protein DedA with SNARE-associated domain